MLGVTRDADQKAIKDAFRALALKYHPDRNKEAGAEERFKEIAAAYAVLSDPTKRSAYDARGFAGVAGFSEEDLFRGADLATCSGALVLMSVTLESAAAFLSGSFTAGRVDHRAAPTST